VNDDDTRLALRPAEAAKALGVHRATIYRLLESGQLPSVTLGRARLIRVEDLRKLLARNME
jgi:excisionase family DNA binding protein